MTDLQTQYNAVRNDIGLIDRSSVGKIAIYGADRFSWLQGMVSNDMRSGLQKGWYADFTSLRILDATGHILRTCSWSTHGWWKKAHALIGATWYWLRPDFVLADLPRENVAKIAGALGHVSLSWKTSR